MKFLKKKEFKDLLINNPTTRYCFLEWIECCAASDIHISSGNIKSPCFGAVSFNFSGNDDFIWNYDWNLEEYSDDSIFCVLEIDEIIKIIHFLNKSINTMIEEETY